MNRLVFDPEFLKAFVDAFANVFGPAPGPPPAPRPGGPQPPIPGVTAGDLRPAVAAARGVERAALLRTADLAAGYRDHLGKLGVGPAGVRAYLEAERAVLAEAYTAAQAPTPSPSVLLGAALRFATDARRPAAGLVVRRAAAGWEIGACRPATGRFGVPEPPAAYRPPAKPFAGHFLAAAAATPPDAAGVVALVEALLGGPLAAAAAPGNAPAVAIPEEAAPQYVTLDQMAAVIGRAKRTLERAKQNPESAMPPPDVPGGRGRAAEWEWARVRPWLAAHSARRLPERFPADRS